MYHSVIFCKELTVPDFVSINTFGEDFAGSVMNSFDDWHLVPSSRPVINPPGIKEEYTDLPGGNGTLDFTDALTGDVFYEDRTGSIEFYVANSYDADTWAGAYESWEHLYSRIMHFLQGKKVAVILEDDPYYYYEGRCAVSEWESAEERSVITIDYVLAPYKHAIMQTIQSVTLTEDSPTATITLPPNDEPIVPDIEIQNGTVLLEYEDISEELATGVHSDVYDLVLGEEERVVTFTWVSGETVTVYTRFRGGLL